MLPATSTFQDSIPDAGPSDCAVPRRIVSLLPAATEIVAALGLGDRLIGRSHLCDHPPSVLGLPQVTQPRLPHQRPAPGTAGDGRRTLAEAISVHAVDLDQLRTLAPDAVVTRSLAGLYGDCEADTRASLAAYLRRPTCRLVTVAPGDLAGVWTEIAAIGRALGVAAPAEALAARLAASAAALGAGFRSRYARFGARSPRMCVIEWLDPVIVGGNWVPDMIALAGCADPVGGVGTPSRRISFDELEAADLDILVMAPCSLSLAHASGELSALLAEPRWHRLKAVQQRRVVTVDGDRLLARSGPRLLEGITLLGEIAAWMGTDGEIGVSAPAPAGLGARWDWPQPMAH